MFDAQPAGPIPTRFSWRPVSGSLPPGLPNNVQYRLAIAAFQRFECLIGCQGQIIQTTTANVSTNPTTLRDPDEMAIATIASNTGNQPVNIYEDGKLVLILPAGKSEQLPLTGNLAITGNTTTGTVGVSIHTLRRCLCGDQAPTSYYLNGDDIPIGHDLI